MSRRSTKQRRAARTRREWCAALRWMLAHHDFGVMAEWALEWAAAGAHRRVVEQAHHEPPALRPTAWSKWDRRRRERACVGIDWRAGRPGRNARRGPPMTLSMFDVGRDGVAS